ncbi:hypothetical protein ACFVVU_11900 [Kitasatospora sp. NPDC057965]
MALELLCAPLQTRALLGPARSDRTCRSVWRTRY